MLINQLQSDTPTRFQTRKMGALFFNNPLQDAEAESEMEAASEWLQRASAATGDRAPVRCDSEHKIPAS